MKVLEMITNESNSIGWVTSDQLPLLPNQASDQARSQYSQ